MSENGTKLKATYDYSKVSRKWQDQFSASAERVTKLVVLAERPLRRQAPGQTDVDYDDYVQAFYDNKEKIGADIRAEGAKQATFVADVLVDVPREWLLADAPENLDWSNPDNFDYIQLAYYAEILDEVRSGGAMKQSKNSEGHSHTK